MKRILIFFFLLFCTFISQIVEAKDYMLVCGKQDGVAKVWYLDLETSLSTGVSDVVGEVELKDESGNVITAIPLGITSDGQKRFWASFDDRRIRKYNITGEPGKVDATNWYWQVSSSPDGLYYDGSRLQYCSSSNNKIYRINLSNGQETDLGVVKRRFSLDGVATDNTSVNYTTQEYTGYNPNSLSGNYLVSGGLGKISKRDLSIGANFIQTIPTGTPIWTNEQDTPASCLGITQIADSSVPEGHVVYLSCTDGNVYKVRFEDEVGSNVPVSYWLIGKQIDYGSSVSYMTHAPSMGTVHKYHYVGGGRVSIGRRYHIVSPPRSFLEAKVVYSGYYRSILDLDMLGIINGYYYLSGHTVNICSYNEAWTLEQKFNAPISTVLWSHEYDGTPFYQGNWYNSITRSSRVNVIDLTTIIPTTTFYYTSRYNNEGQDLIPSGFPNWSAGEVYNSFSPADNWAFLTDNGSLETLGQFTTATSSIDSQDITVTKNLNITKDIHTDPIPFYPSLEADPASKTKIRYKTIVKPEKVGFEIRNLITSSLIYRIDLLGTDPVIPDKLFDEYEYEWNGKDTAGQIISKGLYSINVKLKDSQNNLLYDSATSPQLYAYAYPPSINTSARTATFNYQVWAWGTPAPETKVYMNLYDDEFRLIKRLVVGKEIPVSQQQTITWNYSTSSLGKYYYTIYAEDKRGEQAHIRGGSFTVPDHQIVGTRESLLREKTGWKFEGPIIRVRQPSMVAVGDSITAGMQHMTLVNYLQLTGYANLIAHQMDLDKFDLPLINPPGAPRPIFRINAQDRIIPEIYLTYANYTRFRWPYRFPLGVGEEPSRVKPNIFAHNIAVPGADTAQVLNTQVDVADNRLFELVLQGRLSGSDRGTEVIQAVSMRPNLIIFWTGNNDVLGAALTADIGQLTDPVDFERDFREVVRRLKEWTDPDGPTGPLKGADIIVSDIPDVTSIPNLFRVGEPVGDLPFEVFRMKWGWVGPIENVTNQVENFVIPRGVRNQEGEEYPEGTLIPIANLVLHLVMHLDANPNDTILAENEVLTPGVDLNNDGDFNDLGEFPNEIEQVAQRVNHLNTIIRDVASGYNIPVVSISNLLRTVDTTFTGGNFSFDGVHPSNRGHRLVANEFIRKLNEVIQERGSFGNRDNPINELIINP